MSLFRIEAKIYGAWQLDTSNILSRQRNDPERYSSLIIAKKIRFLKRKPNIKFKPGKSE
ncbi:MAG TPA: hypothetical protein VGD14_03635 [bacterium]